MRFCATILSIFIGISTTAFADQWVTGTGKGDITGPIAGLGMLGYARLEQKTTGIHTRLHARAFYLNDGKKSAVIVATELCMVTTAIKLEVMKRLSPLFDGEFDYDNVMLIANHTHSGPGAVSHHALYNLTTLGFSENNLHAIADGVVKSIVEAKQNAKRSIIKYNEGDLVGANRNRATQAYKLNPQEERELYDTDTDVTMKLFGFFDEADRPFGMINWFPAHAVSMEGENTLISSDNKGLASLRFEDWASKKFGPHFSAAFANANAGDASPNIDGDVDGDGDWECDANEDIACTSVSANQHVRKAKDLFDSLSERVDAKLDYRHAFVDFSAIELASQFATQNDVQTTCPPAIGIMKLAGSSEDGPGVMQEGQGCDELPFIFRLITCPPQRTKCQGKKPIIVNSKRFDPPWTPYILPVQVLQIGQIALLGVPAEFTTMSGRRLREALAPELAKIGVKHIVIAGYANGYSGYVTTREEYDAQLYEGASTHFGPNTSAAYRQVLSYLAEALVTGEEVDSLPPPNYSGKQRIVNVEGGNDRPPRWKDFGDLLSDAKANYDAGDRVKVSFWSAKPRTKHPVEGSYIEIQKQKNGVWKTLYKDSSETTIYRYQKRAFSKAAALIEWHIPEGTKGLFRIKHNGIAMVQGTPRKFSGRSRTFQVR